MKKNDIIMLIGLILIAGVFGVGMIVCRKAFSDENSMAEVTLDGELYGIYPLSEDASIRIENDGNINVLTIRDGKADMTEADCRDLICVHHAPIYAPGETIVCLPHKVVVTVVKEL